MKESIDIFFSNANTCECGCGQIVNPGRRFIHNHHRKVKHIKSIMNTCECGCGRPCKNRFVHGHHRKVKHMNTCECGCGKLCKRRFVSGHNKPTLGRKHTEEAKQKLRNVKLGKKLTEEHIKNMSEANKGEKSAWYGKYHTEKTRKLQSESRKKYLAEHPEASQKGKNKDGGYFSKNIPKYDTYAHQISYAEQVRRNIEDQVVLEVKCTYCGKWFVPTVSNISSRINALNGKTSGENRLYCSNQCKHECPIFNKVKYSAEETGHNQYAREVQPELRQMVFERDNWTCSCGSTESLHCHHREGPRWEPLESADIDMCITKCKNCHHEIHKKEGCGYQDMKCGPNLELK